MAKFNFTVSPTDPAAGLTLSIWHNDKKVFDSVVDQPVDVNYEFDDSEDGQQSIILELCNKRPEHTQLDTQGSIIKDALLQVGRILLEDIDITQIVYDTAKYKHNFNGTGQEIIDKFYGSMGCNGTVDITFSTPIYMWMLEKM